MLELNLHLHGSVFNSFADAKVTLVTKKQMTVALF
jgi:hypothetical protein